jgi:hypothetical protein
MKSTPAERIFLASGLAVSASVLALGGAVLGSSVHQRQEVNQESSQLQQELSGQYDPINRLTVDDWNLSFSFQTNENGQAETCRGQYEVHQDIASPVGAIACEDNNTVTVNLGN